MSEQEHNCVREVLDQPGFDYVNDADEFTDMGNGGVEGVYECPVCETRVAMHLSNEAHFVEDGDEWVEQEP